MLLSSSRLGVWVLLGEDHKVARAVFLLETSGEIEFSAFLFLWSAHTPWIMDSSPYELARWHSSANSLFVFPTFDFPYLSPYSTLKGPVLTLSHLSHLGILS